MHTDSSDERGYLRQRAGQHRRQAAATSNVAQRLLHERFALLYDARRDALPVQDD